MALTARQGFLPATILAVWSFYCAVVNCKEFDLKPGGMVQDVSAELDGMVCQFRFAAQGGTKENWQINFKSLAQPNHYQCVVERPGGMSYLFFQEFKLEVVGAKVHDGIAMGPSGVLPPNEYIVVKELNGNIRHKDGQFSSQLARVELDVVAAHGEL